MIKADLIAKISYQDISVGPPELTGLYMVICHILTKKKMVFVYFCVLVNLLFFSSISYSSWESNGPWGGYVESITNPTAGSDIIYAGTWHGVYKSNNRGLEWFMKGLQNTAVKIVACYPSNPEIVYAATYDQLFKTTDGGESWHSLGFSDININDIAIYPSNPDIVLIAGDGKIFRSTDGGSTWSIAISNNIRIVYDILIDKIDPTIVYAGTSPSYSSQIDDDFYKSTDCGASWTGMNVDSNDNIYELDMSKDENESPIIYARGSLALHKSYDQGETWEEEIDFPGLFPKIAVNPEHPSTLYAGTENYRITYPSYEVYEHSEFYKSTDGGNTWTLIDSGLPEAGIDEIRFDLLNDSILVALSGGGVYSYNKSRKTWVNHSKGIGSSVYDLSIHPKDSSTVCASLWSQHIAFTKNGGNSWTYFLGKNSPRNVLSVEIDRNEPDMVLFSGFASQERRSAFVHRSLNGGDDWTPWKLFPLKDQKSEYPVYDILNHPNDSTKLYASVYADPANAGGLYFSNDGGTTWQKAYEAYAKSIAIDPQNSSVMYLGSKMSDDTCGGAVLQSTNGGKSWSICSPGCAWVDSVRDIAIDSNSNLIAASNEGLWKWDGHNWEKLTGLPTENITTVALNRFVVPEEIYVGTRDKGIYVSYDMGAEWNELNDELKDLAIASLAVSPSQPRILYAGTYFSGVWSKPIFQDQDNDGLPDEIEALTCTDSKDADSDNDGIMDGIEDSNRNGRTDYGETHPCKTDTDGDGLQDGTEIGLEIEDCPDDTDEDIFQPDVDPSTTTDPLDNDTDNDGILDGEEDTNHNGRLDPGETDPNDNPNKAVPWPLLLLEE